MTNRRGFLTILVLALCAAALVVSGCAHRAPDPAVAQPASVDAPASTPAAPADADDPFPLDPAIIAGKLDNGLRYFIRKNVKPKDRAELRLVVNAGSILEDDDQRGLAHFVEHMAFNGTTHFEKQELVDYLEGIGMRFGADLNAYTNTDETVYMLQVPTDDDEAVDTAFRILEDWAHGITFEGEEIDKERGVVVEEWRRGRGARARVRDEQWPVIFEGSRYAERLTIGDKETLEHAPHDALRRFYRDWYRPDLMAVVAVGDFDPAAIETLIRERFEGIVGPDDARPREAYGVPDHDRTRIKIATDPELTSTNVVVAWMRDPHPTRTLDDFRLELVDALYHGMTNARLDELRQRADPPYLYGFGGESGWVRAKSMYALQASVADGGLERGLSTLLTEARRVREHGFLPTELERAKTDLLRSFERQLEEADKQESSRHAGQLVGHFLEGEPLPGIERLAELAGAIVPSITLEEVEARAGQWITPGNRVILVSGPDSEQAGIPDEATVLATFDAADAAAIEPWVDQVRNEPLVAMVPDPGAVVEETSIEDLGVTVWTLSNGARVVLKPTDFKNDQVVLRGWSPGGSSLVSDDDYLSAEFAASVISEGGLGEFSAIELDKALSGKIASVRGYIGDTSEGISGGASPRDLETMFQLLYLQFTAPRRDEEAFGAFLARMNAMLENQQASPDFWFSKQFSEVMSQGHVRGRMLTPELLDEIDLDRAIEIWRDRFADASDFWFFLVGSFDLETIRPMVEHWIASLPATDRGESWRDVGPKPPVGVHRFEVRRGIEPKASVRLVFTGDATWNRIERYAMWSMTQALSIRLREVLREDLGGVYGVGVSGSISRWPNERYSTYVSFGCDPERVDELIAAARAEIDVFRADGPPQAVVDKVHESQIRGRETSLEENGWWTGTLQSQFINGLDPLDILRFEELLSQLTTDLLRDAAVKYFDPERVVQGVLLPEAPEGTVP